MGKFYVPLAMTVIAAVLTGFQMAFVTDQTIDSQEWVQVVILAVMSFNVWATANLPGYERMKTYVAAALLVLQSLYTFVIGGVSTAELINLALTFFGALGVAVTTQQITRATVINDKAVLITPN